VRSLRRNVNLCKNLRIAKNTVPPLDPSAVTVTFIGPSVNGSFVVQVTVLHPNSSYAGTVNTTLYSSDTTAYIDSVTGGTGVVGPTSNTITVYAQPPVPPSPSPFPTPPLFVPTQSQTVQYTTGTNATVNTTSASQIQPCHATCNYPKHVKH